MAVSGERLNLSLALRAHHLLCLQGFRGKGYSREFTENLAAIAERLKLDPAAEVAVVCGVDDICGPCPHRVEDRCAKDGQPGAEPTSIDSRVLLRLGFHEGQKASWMHILRAIKYRIRCEDLETICGGCQWLAEGCCADGLKNLIWNTVI